MKQCRERCLALKWNNRKGTQKNDVCVGHWVQRCRLTDPWRWFRQLPRLRNRPFQKEVEVFEFLLVIFLFLLISSARRGILKVLKKCLLNESVKRDVIFAPLLGKRIHMIQSLLSAVVSMRILPKVFEMPVHAKREPGLWVSLAYAFDKWFA